MKDKISALILYLSGMSMSMIAQIIGVGLTSIIRWIGKFSDEINSEDLPKSRFEEMEVDEMCSLSIKKRSYLDPENC